MGSIFAAFEKLPSWQRLLILVGGAALLAAGWYFLYYSDARDRRTAAEAALASAKNELAQIEDKKRNFMERQRKQAEIEAELNKKMEVLPMSIASVDNLMQTFQQQARLVGLTVESWVPDSEIREDYYARLPVTVRATGSWAQAGEFFRRVSELDRIVSVDNITLKGTKTTVTRPNGEQSRAPVLDIQFQAATYRFLSEQERATGGAQPSRRTRRQR